MSQHKDRLKKLHDKIQRMKGEKREIRQMIKDELQQDDRYRDVQEELKELRAERRSIKTRITESNPDLAAKLDDLKTEIKSCKELRSDIAFNMLVNNEQVEITDEKNNRYVPQFKVRFKKAN